MKTFEDLVFEEHPIAKGAETLPYSIRQEYGEARWAVMKFENGYGVSVLLGRCFYSNGIDTYELGILLDGSLCYTSGITDDVMGRLTKDEVTTVMAKVQSL